jgi:flagella basal body P-ring formation protein FlgA
MQRVALLIVAIMLPLTAAAVEVTLREQTMLTGSVVRLGDIAELSGADAAIAAELATVALQPAPAAGSRQFLGVAQIRDLLAASGVDVSELQFRGAAAVSIAAPNIEVAETADDSTPRDDASSGPTRPDREATAAHVAAVITRYLQEKTGHDLWEVKVDAEPEVLETFWQYGPQLAVSGGRAPWAGRQQFELRGAGAKQSVRAYAKVQKLELAVFAAEAIEAGDLIRAAEVTVRPFAGVMPSQAARSLDQIVGKEAIQPIRADAMLLTGNVRSPLLVRRGERVAIRARAAGVIVRTYATAQQNGCLGDLIQVQALEGKDRYAARVSGLRELDVFAGAMSAHDVTAANR